MMKKILVIDDDAAVRESLSDCLAMDGFEVLSAPNGREGLRICEESSPDVVLTDIVMPDMDGIEVVQALRDLHPACKVIAMSGGWRLGTSDFLRIAKSLGADATLAKPFDLDVLAATISSLA